MNFQSLLEKENCSTALRGGTLALLIAWAVSSPAVAAPIRVQAQQDQSVESSFALDFGLGGVASALISRTDFELEVDGLTGSARFLSYDQDIDALTLPGPLSTGAIRVQIVPGSSAGTYNRATGEFVTNELYNIEFDGDLSAYGLVSPVILPSQSVGVVDIESSTVGRVTMNWAGTNLHNPSVPLDFSYICTLFASFSVGASSYIEVELVALVENTNMTASLRSSLIALLEGAMERIGAHDTRTAASYLNRFLYRVRIAGTANLAQADALALTNSGIIALRLTQYQILPLERAASSGKASMRTPE